MMPIRPNSKIIGLAPRSMSTSTGISSLHDEEIEFELREAFREPPPADFKPSLRLYLAFLTLAVITMAVALDGTSLSVALPVSLFDIVDIVACSWSTQYRSSLKSSKVLLSKRSGLERPSCYALQYSNRASPPSPIFSDESQLL